MHHSLSQFYPLRMQSSVLYAAAVGRGMACGRSTRQCAAHRAMAWPRAS